MRAVVLIAVMAGVTALTRFLPFLIFRRNIPDYVLYLGRVLPPAIIGMLVVYCLKSTSLTAPPLDFPSRRTPAATCADTFFRTESLSNMR